MLLKLLLFACVLMYSFHFVFTKKRTHINYASNLKDSAGSKNKNTNITKKETVSSTNISVLNYDEEDEDYIEGEKNYKNESRSSSEDQHKQGLANAKLDDNDEDEYIDDEDEDGTLFYTDLKNKTDGEDERVIYIDGKDEYDEELDDGYSEENGNDSNLEGEDDEGEDYYGAFEQLFGDVYHDLGKGHVKDVKIITEKPIEREHLKHFIHKNRKKFKGNKTAERVYLKPQNITLALRGAKDNVKFHVPSVIEKVRSSNLKNLVNEITNLVSSVVNTGQLLNSHREKKDSIDREELEGRYEGKARCKFKRGCDKDRQRKKRRPAKWTQWSPWSSCSVTCGHGRSVRWRDCLHSNCNTAEKEFEEVPCQLPDCSPINLFGLLR